MVRVCRKCGKTSNDPDEVFAGLCYACLTKMASKPEGQAVVVPTTVQLNNIEKGAAVLDETPVEAWRRLHKEAS